MNLETIRNDFECMIQTMGIEAVIEFVEITNEEIVYLQNELLTLDSICSNPYDETKIKYENKIKNDELYIEIAKEILNKYNK